MKKKQKGKLVLGLFMGCCLLYAMSGFSTKSVQAAASLQKEDGQLVGGKAQDISPAGKYKPKENEDAKNTEVKSQDTKSTEAENIEVKDQEEQKSTGTNDLTQNATGASAQSGTYGNVIRYDTDDHRFRCNAGCKSVRTCTVERTQCKECSDQ